MYVVSYAPTIEQLKQIELWLKSEDELSGEGYYCNWQIIERSFYEKELAVLLHNGESIGFVVFSLLRDSARIEILEIVPKSRLKGLASLLVRDLLDGFGK